MPNPSRYNNAAAQLVPQRAGVAAWGHLHVQEIVQAIVIVIVVVIIVLVVIVFKNCHFCYCRC